MQHTVLELGRADLPEAHTQPIYRWDMTADHLAILGEDGTGKKTAVQNLLAQLHLRSKREAVYILTQGGALCPLASLPFVAATVNTDEEEATRRIFRLVEEQYNRNKKALQGVDYAAADPETAPCHVTFILHGADSFFAQDKADADEQTRTQEFLLLLARRGLTAGVTLVLTAAAPTGLSRLLGYNFRVVATRLAKAEWYGDLFAGRVAPPLPVPGRGIAMAEQDKRKNVEFQGYYPFPPQLEGEAFWARLSRCALAQGAQPVEKVKTITGDLTAERWPEYTDIPFAQPGIFAAGIEYTHLQPLTLDLRTAGSIAICGKRFSGRRTMLAGILRAALALGDVRTVLWDSGSHRLEPLLPLFEGHTPPKQVHSMKELLAEWGPAPQPEQPEPPVTEAPSMEVPSMEAVNDFIGGLDGTMFHPLDGIAPPLPPVEQPRPREAPPADTAPAAALTVYIIEASSFYCSEENAAALANLLATAVEQHRLFVFTGLKGNSKAAGELLAGQVQHTFVLDSIPTFCVNAKGSTRFSTFNQKELAEEFGKGFEAGDGYYLATDADELIKLKTTLHRF